MADQITADLFAALLEWDGRTTSTLRNIYNQHAGRDGFLGAVLQLCASRQVERGATWLFKHHCEETAVSLDGSKMQAFYGAMKELQHWEARLHILQSLWSFKSEVLDQDICRQFIEENLASENKFVRAWSYYGFAELATRFPNLQEEARALLETALERENAGSIKARIKKGLKLL